MDNFYLARANMVKGQVMPNKIVDRRIIDIMLEVPRHLFVPDNFKSIAYSDELIVLNDSRCLIPPMDFAQLVQSLEIKSDDVVLVVACGRGYSSTVVSHLCKKVVAIESDSDLATKANYMIKKLDIGNVIVLNGRLSQGHADGAPYDAIFCNGALSGIPHDLLSQLAEGGRLVAVINDGTGGKATLFVKNDGIISKHYLFDANLPILNDFNEA